MQNLCSRIDHKVYGSFPVRSQKIMMSNKIINRCTCRHIVHYKEIYFDKTNVFLKVYFIDFLHRGGERDRELETLMREKH